MGVNPGMVFSSFTTNVPSSRKKKSTRAIASHRHASKTSTARRCTSAVWSRGDRCGREQLRLAVLVLVGIVVKVGGRDDLARQGRDRRVVAQHAHLDLAAAHHPLGEHPLVERQRVLDRAPKLFGGPRLADADRGSHVRRLDETRQAELVLRPCAELVDVVARAQREIWPDLETRGREHALHRDLVHADRRTEHPRADIRKAGELEEALDRSVLAVGPVQQREHDIGVEVVAHTCARQCHGVTRHVERRGKRVTAGREHALRFGGEQPLTLCRDAHRNDVVPVGIERARNGYRGHAGDVMLRRLAAEQQQDPSSAHPEQDATGVRAGNVTGTAMSTKEIRRYAPRAPATSTRRHG